MQQRPQSLLPDCQTIDILPVHDPLHIMADSNQLRQMLENLVSNASEAYDGKACLAELRQLNPAACIILSSGYVRSPS